MNRHHLPVAFVDVQVPDVPQQARQVGEGRLPLAHARAVAPQARVLAERAAVVLLHVPRYARVCWRKQQIQQQAKDECNTTLDLILIRAHTACRRYCATFSHLFEAT